MDFEKELSELYPWIIRMAKRYHSSMQDAEDLAGDTIYKMLINRDKFDSEKDIKPWCLAVMRNTYITRYNRNALICFTGFADIIEPGSTFDSFSFIIFNDILSLIHRCAQRSCCIESVLYCAKGYSYDEISQILNIPVSTVRSRISFGRKIIKQELEM